MLESLPQAMARILAVDWGERRVGLAACDASEMLASPHSVLTRKNDRQVVGEVAAVASEIGAELLVVGLPLNMDGTEGESAARARKLARYLAAATGLEVLLRDERLSSEEAARRLREGGKSSREMRGKLDAVAAAVVLEDFLAERRANKTEETS